MTTHDASSSDRVLADRYRLGARRGTGIDVAVFDALDLGLGRSVLVKIVHPDLCAEEGFDARFRSMMQRAASIDHPNVARVLDWGAGEWNGRSVQFVVSEPLASGTVRDLLDRGRQLSPSQTVMIGLDACRGLDVVHRLGLVHGDLRPATLGFGDDGKLKLLDLGLARVVTEPLWADPSSINLERARYAAPEQATDGRTEAKSDVYALCLTLIETLTGQLPFMGDSTVATLANRVDKLMPVSADFGPLAAVFERAGRPHPADRSTAAELGRSLVSAAEKLPRPAPLEIASTGLFAQAAPASSPPTGQQVRTDASGAIPRPATSDDTGTVGLARPLNTFDAPSGQVPVIAPAPTGISDLASLDVPAGSDGSQPTPTRLLPTSNPARATDAPVAGSSSAGAARASSDAASSGAGEASVVTPPPPPQPDISAPILREKRSRRKLIAVLVVAILAAGVGGGLAWWFGREQPNAVPELVGLDKDEALNRISEFGWETSIVEEFDDTVGAGVVIRTEPAAGEKLDEGDAFTIVSSLGPSPRTLPDLTGSTVEQATTTLQALQLVIQVSEQVNDEVVPAGTIISWSIPDAPGVGVGDNVLPGTSVLVVVSAGPAPRTVPDLTNLSLVDATAQLTELGLVVAQLPDEFSPTVPVGVVARQDPPVGTSVARGSTVSVAISKGPDLVVVPPLAALTVQQASDALTAAGLVLGQVKGDPTGVAVLAEVGGQSIGADVSLPRGTAIDVTFEVPPPPTTLPPETTVDPTATTAAPA